MWNNEKAATQVNEKRPDHALTPVAIQANVVVSSNDGFILMSSSKIRNHKYLSRKAAIEQKDACRKRREDRKFIKGLEPIKWAKGGNSV